jgi:carboxyl-terminal processing protease
VMQDFRKFLDEQKITFNEAEFSENNDWLRSNIKAELFLNEFGQAEGMHIKAATDPYVVKALDLLPQAKLLADNARHVIAQRNSSKIGEQQ